MIRREGTPVGCGAVRELGVRRLVLETGIRQLGAIALYRSTGFQPVPLYGEYRNSPAISVCMGKELSPSDPPRR